MNSPKYDSPKPSNLNKRSVHRLAESIASQLNYKPGGDLKDVVAKLGGKISVKNFWDTGLSDSGSMVVEAAGKFDIFVSTDTSLERDKFTIAHELGHYVLHFLWPNKNGTPIQSMAATRYGSDRVEWEANWFAAAFLMPESEFRSKFKEFRHDIGAVSSYFGVSQAAAKVRAEGLGLL